MWKSAFQIVLLISKIYLAFNPYYWVQNIKLANIYFPYKEKENDTNI